MRLIQKLKINILAKTWISEKRWNTQNFQNIMSLIIKTQDTSPGFFLIGFCRSPGDDSSFLLAGDPVSEKEVE